MSKEIPQSRKAFFRKAFGFAGRGVAHHMERKITKSLEGPIRPPGALPEVEFISACTRCEACIAACPYGAIQKSRVHAGLGAGTPMIDPATEACHLCPDMPCITACEPGALRPLGEARPTMGTAVINQETCQTYEDRVCTHCYDACPFPEEAIAIDSDFHPQILAGCVGCGLCQHSCPVSPVGVAVFSPLAMQKLKHEEDPLAGYLGS